MREPDWNALADLQFLLYNRISGALNEAVSSMELSDMPEAQDKPPGYWKNRATSKVVNVLNLFNAWTYLIRFKQGLPIPERAIRPFRANELLKWVGVQLQLNPIPQLQSNPLLRANQETLQEAILLLHSAAYTQGSGVRMAVEASKLGAWFKVRFARSKPLPNTLEELLESFGDHWRAQDTVFELKTARDFVALNEAELVLITTPTHGEFTFFVRAAGRVTLPPLSDKPTWPSKTRELDPASVAAYETKVAANRVKPAAVVDVKGEADAPAQVEKTALAAVSGESVKDSAAQPDTPASAAPVKPGGPDLGATAPLPPEPAAESKTTAGSDATPVIQSMRAQPPTKAAPPSRPAVDVLRPLPPKLSELQRQAAMRAEKETKDKAAALPQDTVAPAASEAESPGEAQAEPKIVSLKLPVPTPPPQLLERLQPEPGKSVPAKEPLTQPDVRTSSADDTAPGTESGEHSTPPAAHEKSNDESADKAANGSADHTATRPTDPPSANTRKDTP